MMKRSVRSLRGKSIDELRNELQQELYDIWDSINKLLDAVDASSKGERKSSDDTSNIRLIQSEDGYYVEGRFQDGWARLNTSFTPITKK